jgi:Zn-dependent peptidase ImmA (M78 family)
MLKPEKTQKTISVAKYAKKLGVSPQVVYQRIATGKLVQGKDWVTERQERFLKRIVVKSKSRSKK